MESSPIQNPPQKCVYFSYEEKSFQAGSEYCVGKGAFLASINSPEGKDNFLLKISSTFNNFMGMYIYLKWVFKNDSYKEQDRITSLARLDPEALGEL